MGEDICMSDTDRIKSVLSETVAALKWANEFIEQKDTELSTLRQQLKDSEAEVKRLNSEVGHLENEVHNWKLEAKTQLDYKLEARAEVKGLRDGIEDILNDNKTDYRPSARFVIHRLQQLLQNEKEVK